MNNRKKQNRSRSNRAYHDGTGGLRFGPAVLSAMLIMILFTSFHCALEKPSAPSWDVDVAIPLISKTYTMEEIADDEDAISVDSTGILSFQETSELDAYYVGDELDVDDQHEGFNQTLGVFSIDSPGEEFTAVELREIFADAQALDGLQAVVPSFSFTTEKKQLEAFDDFSYVIIDSGFLNIAINNDLAVPLGSPITLEVWDTATDTLVVSVSENRQIDPGTSSSMSADLAGLSFSSRLSLRMLANSPGSSGELVTVRANSRFQMGGEVTDLEVSEAMAAIPAQSVSSSDYVTISDSLVVVDAEIQDGTISLALAGTIPLDIWLIYEFPDFLTPAGDTFIDSLFIANNSSTESTINLQGFSLQPQMADFAAQRVRFNWSIRTIDTGVQQVRVRSVDGMDAGFDLTGLRFSEVTGKIGEQRIEVTQDDIEFDIPADLDSIFFETAELELQVNNRVNFPARVVFEIEGRNDAGSVTYLQVDDVIQPATEPGVPVQTKIVLNRENSNITDFISILPNLIRVAGNVKLGDPNWVGTISQDDFVDGQVKVSAPFSLRLPTQSIDSEVNDLNIDDDVKDDVIDNLANGEFFAEISNHLPVGASFEVVFAQTRGSVFENPILQIGPLRTDGAAVDASGYVLAAEKTDLTFSLTEAQLRTFLSDSLYSGVRVLLDGTGDQFVKVRSSDFIQIKSYTKVKVKVNQD